jgi:hypothetical protein
MDLEAFVQEQTKLKRKHTMEREDEEGQADKTEAEELERLRQVSLNPNPGLCSLVYRISLEYCVLGQF